MPENENIVADLSMLMVLCGEWIHGVDASRSSGGFQVVSLAWRPHCMAFKFETTTTFIATFVFVRCGVGIGFFGYPSESLLQVELEAYRMVVTVDDRLIPAQWLSRLSIT